MTLRDSGAFSFRNAVIAEIDGEVAALLVDYALDDPYVIGDLTDMPDFISPLVRLEAQAPGSWYVNVLATFPEFRGKGLGARLLAQSEARGRAWGSRIMSIIVAGENELVKKRYRVVRIAPTSITMEDTQGRGQQTIQIEGQPAA